MAGRVTGTCTRMFQPGSFGAGRGCSELAREAFEISRYVYHGSLVFPLLAKPDTENSARALTTRQQQMGEDDLYPRK